MEVIKNKEFGGERPLFTIHDTRLESITITDGESGIKQCQNIEAQNCRFYGKYPWWHVDGALIEDCYFALGSRSAIWYSSTYTAATIISYSPSWSPPSTPTAPPWTPYARRWANTPTWKWNWNTRSTPPSWAASASASTTTCTTPGSPLRWPNCAKNSAKTSTKANSSRKPHPPKASIHSVIIQSQRYVRN